MTIYLDDYMAALRSKRRKSRCKRCDVRVCASKNWHRQYWYYAGNGEFLCGICEKLDSIAC